MTFLILKSHNPSFTHMRHLSLSVMRIISIEIWHKSSYLCHSITDRHISMERKKNNINENTKFFTILYMNRQNRSFPFKRMERKFFSFRIISFQYNPLQQEEKMSPVFHHIIVSILFNFSVSKVLTRACVVDF